MSSEQKNPPESETAQAPKNGAGADGKAASDDAAKLAEEKAQLNDRLLRLAAEFENYKRRVKKDMEDASHRTVEGLLKEFLPVLDNMDRALQASQGQAATGGLLEGVQLVQRQFLTALEKFQVKPFDAQGKPFDPAFHEAVQQVETDAVPSGHVATVFQRGFTIGSRLLRPALVAVSRGKAAASQSADPLPN